MSKNNNRIPIIRYPQFLKLHAEINYCKRLTPIAGEPHCMSLEGQTGAGKTTLARDYTNMFPRQETPLGAVIPVFYVETPSPVTVKSMASYMLQQIGDPAAERGTLTSMNTRLVGLMRDCKVELVIIDEFNHLVDSKTDRILHSVSDWLKMLIKKTGIPFLVVGIEGQVTRVLNANKQLSRLFASRHILQPFEWNNKDSETIETFATFIRFVEEAIMPATTDIHRSEFLSRLYYATDGVVAHIMNLYHLAAVLAQDRNETTIPLAIFSVAFEKRLRQHSRKSDNPFLIPPDQKFQIPASEMPNYVPNIPISHVFTTH